MRRCLQIEAASGRFAGHRTAGVRPMSEERNLKVRIRFSKLGKILPADQLRQAGFLGKKMKRRVE